MINNCELFDIIVVMVVRASYLNLMFFHWFNLLFLFFFFCRSSRVGVKCSYTDPGIKENSNVGTIDVVADVKTERVCCFVSLLATDYDIYLT